MQVYLIKTSSESVFKEVLADFREDSVDIVTIDPDSLIITARLSHQQARSIQVSIGVCEPLEPGE